MQPQRCAKILAEAVEARYLAALRELLDRSLDGAQGLYELRPPRSGLELGGRARRRTIGVHEATIAATAPDRLTTLGQKAG